MNLRQQQARDLLAAGISILPIRPDGTKAPTVKWEGYQGRRATDREVQRWFPSMCSGIGIIGGRISGGLEVLDFDDGTLFEPWGNLVNDLYPGLTAMLPTVYTPTGGYHVYYRAQEIEHNQKLARAPFDGKRTQVKIETRGEGGYVLSPWCHPNCHALRRCYQVWQGDLLAMPLISQQARAVLLKSARAFDECADRPRPLVPRQAEGYDERPGDAFAAAHTWHEILEPHGWRAVGQHQGMTYWKRTDKRDRGWSATTGHDGHDVLYVFSTNAFPFEADRGYSKFTAHVLLTYDGDFSAAARAVSAQRRDV
jgi:hypothetical protein